jgi:hypothetical protein
MNERRQIKVEHIVPYAERPATDIVRRGSSFVAPAPTPPVTIDAPAWLVERQPLALENVWTPTVGTQEHTSAMDRAKALQVRLATWAVLWALIAVAVGVITTMAAKQWPVGALATILLFACLTAVTYYNLNRTDYDYSHEGTERHRLDTAADLMRRQQKYEHEARNRALDIYLETLKHDKGGRR